MSLKVAAFKTADELVVFANSIGLAAATVESIRTRDGMWYIFYWE